MASRLAFLSVLMLVACGDDSGSGPTETDTSGSTGSTTMVDPSAADDSSTGTQPTTDPSTSSSTSTAVDDSSSSSGEPDAPPEVTLTVAGETRPGTQSGADRVPLAAEATDDGAIDRVEFYRDGELIATDEEAPYEADVLLTSLDNATLEFLAVAYDDGGQSADSNSVSLEVAVVGANIQHVATDLLEAGGLAYAPGGGVAVAEDGTVFVATSTLDSMNNAFGVRAARVSADLSSVEWNLRVPAVADPNAEQILGFGEPVLLEEAGRLLIAGTAAAPDVTGYAATVVSFPVDGSAPSVPYQATGLDTQSFNVPGLVRGPNDDIILHGPDDTLSRISAGVPLWQVPTAEFTIGDLGATHMSSDAAGDVLFDVFECSTDPCTWTVHRILGADGSEAWAQTVPADVDLSDFHVGASVTAPNGDVVLAFGQAPDAGGDIRIVRWDADGNELETFDLDSGAASLTVSDLAFDAQGQLVLLGSRVDGGDADANLIRMAPDGTILWERSFGFGTERDLSLAFTFDDRGRVVMAGLADPQSGFLVFSASLWLAVVDL